jgi:hypothetical protein
VAHRSPWARLVLIVGLVLLAGWLGEAAHQHAASGGDHCVVCTAAHVPVIAPAASPSATPHVVPLRIVAPDLEGSPLEVAVLVLGARAPPLG